MANSNITGLTTSAALTGAEEVPIYQSGATFKTTTQDIANLGGGGTTPLTTKGDLFGYDTANARIPVGTNGQVLTADSAETLGVKWATPSSGSGDFVGPASSTDNAVVRFDSTTGKLGQNSSVIIDDSNNVSGVGTLATGNQTITGTQVQTSTSATALVVGANGSTNPALTVDASTASSATGISIASRAAGAGAVLTATSSAGTESLSLGAKGTGSVALQTNSSTRVLVSGSQTQFSPGARSGTSTNEWQFAAAAGTTLTASTEASLVYWNLGNGTQSHSTGALTLQRDFRIAPTTHLFVGPSTMTNGATLSVDGAPIASTNATITNSSAIYVPGGAVGSNTTNSYALNIAANTGATNNYVAKMGAGVIQQATTTVGALIAAATAGAGARSIVSDASAPTFGTAVTGGGAVVVPVYSDGTNWMVG